MADTQTLSRRERRRARREATEPVLPTAAKQVDSLTAAAVSVRAAQQIGSMQWGNTEWQSEAWLHYRTCPEFRQGINIGANSLSRARLIGVDIDPKTGEFGTQPSDDPDVVAIMGEVLDGRASQGQGLAGLKRQLAVAGDSWLFVTAAADRDGTSWEVLSTADVQSNGSGNVTVMQLDGSKRIVDAESELLIRVWRPDPERRWQADSPTLALLPVLREIAALSAMVSSTVKSRLASAGILWLPDEITLPKPNTPTTSDSQVRADAAGVANAWLDVLTEAMTAPINDPDSAAAVVPLVATVNGDMIDKIQHMEFGRDLDVTLQPLRDADIRRLAVGMNAPPEILTGLGDVNHWTGWLITEDYARAYLAPDLELISDILTRFWLRPALKRRGKPADRYAVYFDLDALVPKQINTENAQAAYNAGLLSEVAYMEALGFSTGQMADPAERARNTVIGLLRAGSLHMPDLGPATLAALFPGMDFPPQPSPEEVAGVGDAAAVPGQIERPALPPGGNAPPRQTPPPTSGPAGPSSA